MSYISAAYWTIGGMIMPLDHPSKLVRAIESRADVDFMERSGSGATIIAHLRRDGDDAVVFEGDGRREVLPVTSTTEEIIQRWEAFTLVEQRAHEAYRATIRGGTRI